MLEAINNLLFANMITIILVFVASLYLLIKSADVFTKYAEQIGLLIGIPQFVVGVTIVSLGTSLPEVATSVFAALKGNTEIVAGNVVGSNVANLLLVIGLVVIVVKTLKIEWDIIKVDLPLLVGSAIILSFFLWDGVFTMGEAIVSLLGYVIFVAYSISLHNHKEKSHKVKFSWKIPFWIILSAVFVALTADYAIRSVLAFVELPTIQGIGIDTSIVAISAVAVGTSLPEVSVSIAAARRKNYEVAIGNVIGSNIFNSFVVIAIPAFIAPLVVSANVLTLAIPFMIAATLLYTFATQDRLVSSYEGWLFLLIYVIFMLKLFSLI